MFPVLPATVAILVIGALVSGVVAAMSAKNRQLGQLQRATISLAVFSSVCMLVTSVYWIPGAFMQQPMARPPPTLPASFPPIGPYR